MAKFTLINPDIFYSGRRLQPDLSAVAISTGADAVDCTNFGSNGWRERLGGLIRAAVQVEGFFDPVNDPTAGGGGESEIFDELGDNHPFTVAPEGGTEGNAAYLVGLRSGSFSPSAENGEVIRYSFEGESTDSPAVSGRLIGNRVGATATLNGSAFQVGDPSGKQIFAALHVWRAAGTSPTIDVTIQSDDNSGMTTPTTRITFPQLVANSGLLVSLADTHGITDDWWRIVATIGGTSPVFNFAVALGFL